MRIVLSLFGTMLPDVWAENSPCSSIDNVSTCVETYQCVSSFPVDAPLDLEPNDFGGIDLSVQVM